MSPPEIVGLLQSALHPLETPPFWAWFVKVCDYGALFGFFPFLSSRLFPEKEWGRLAGCGIGDFPFVHPAFSFFFFANKSSSSLQASRTPFSRGEFS